MWRFPRRVALATGIVLVLVLPTSSVGAAGATPARAGGATFQEGPCPPELSGHARISCGTLVVRDTTHGRGWADTNLAVAIVHASSPTPKADPILFLHGGPGGEIVRQAADVFENSGLATDRDVIVIDQRGGGLSTPELTCPEVDQIDWYGALSKPGDDPGTLRAQRDAVAACQKRLIGDGTDPAAVSTPTIAGDIGAFRTTLGIKQWNVLGFSYGTRVAMALLRDHPQGIRSVLLDSALPLDKSPADPARSGGALEALFGACSASSTCSARHPGLRKEWTDQLRRLDATPVTVQVPASDENPAVTVSVDSTRMVEAALNDFGDRDAIPTLPDTLTAPDATTRAATIAAAHAIPRGPIGAALAVSCREEAPLQPPVHASAETARFPQTSTLWHQCDGWKTKSAPRSERTLPTTRVPTLVLQGQFDGAPDKWEVNLTKNLHARLVRFPGRTHGVVNGDDPCSITVATQFFDSPGTAPDTSCITSTPLP
jgi:pimeloyl-ACP methyl ester carboxylesterase